MLFNATVETVGAMKSSYIETRKAYIEFLSKETFRIVTPLRERTFTLTEEDDMFYIDLINLKRAGSERRAGPFHAFISYDRELGDVVIELDVQVKVRDPGYKSTIRKQQFDSVGLARFDNSPRTFIVKYMTNA